MFVVRVMRRMMHGLGSVVVVVRRRSLVVGIHGINYKLLLPSLPLCLFQICAAYCSTIEGATIFSVQFYYQVTIMTR